MLPLQVHGVLLIFCDFPANIIPLVYKMRNIIFTNDIESVLKPSKQPNKDTGKTDNGVRIERFLFIPGGKTAIVFQLEEKIFHQMTLFVHVTVCFPGAFGSDTVGNHHDSAPLFQPAYKFIAVMAFICQNKFAV